MEVLSVVGARPQFVKLGPICRAIAVSTRGSRLVHRIIHTGQHYDTGMSDTFFRDLDLPRPDINLGIGSGDHGAQTGRMLAGLEGVFLAHRPDLVVVYGDTNSTLAAGLAAAKLHISVAHVEAGLRSFRKEMPEEVNRVLVDHLSTLLCCPTTTAVHNLTKEGIEQGISSDAASVNQPAVVLTGDVMKDAVLQNLERAAQRPETLERLGIDDTGYAVATIHRAENTDDVLRLTGIVEALTQLGSELPVVVPLHPRTRKALSEMGIRMDGHSVRWVEPLSYLDMLWLVSKARLVLTDSGGLQKEAYMLGVPCITLRDETEWVELTDTGWNRLAGANPKRILASARALLEAPPSPASESLYGDGHAAERVLESILAVGR